MAQHNGRNAQLQDQLARRVYLPTGALVVVGAAVEIVVAITAVEVVVAAASAEDVAAASAEEPVVAGSSPQDMGRRFVERSLIVKGVEPVVTFAAVEDVGTRLRSYRPPSQQL